MGAASQVAIDADGHVVETAEGLRAFGWSGSTGHEGIDRLLAEPSLGHRPDLGGGALDPGQRLADMDREGIEVAVNYPTFALLVNQLEAEAASDLCQAYNSWFAATYAAADAHRLRAMALVSLADADSAVSEARRAVTELGAPGIAVSPFCRSVHLGDRSLDALWALAQELDVPVAVHGGRGTTAPHLAPTSFPDSDQRSYYALAHPFGQMMAMGDLVFGGVLERFPTLRFAFLEAGIGWLPWYVDRLDEAYESLPPPDGTDPLPLEPSAYLFGSNCFFSCEPDEPRLEETIRAVGDDRVLFASDYPHFDCKCPHSVDALADVVGDQEVLRNVLEGNARRLYGIR